jgi:hypothetical protein
MLVHALVNVNGGKSLARQNQRLRLSESRKLELCYFIPIDTILGNNKIFDAYNMYSVQCTVLHDPKCHDLRRGRQWA